MTDETRIDRLTAEERRTMRMALRLYRRRLEDAPTLRATPGGQDEWDRIETLLEAFASRP